MKKVAERYHLTTKAAISLIKKHQAELNAEGEHAKIVDGEWEVDDIGIHILDGILHYGESRKEISSLTTPEEADFEVSRLTAALDAKEKEFDELEAEYKRLQDQFMHLKDDTSALNEDLIRKYRTKSETLQKQLDSTISDMNNLRELKDKRIYALENIVSELQSKVKELNHSLQKKIDSDLENLSKSAEADRLMERIHNMETEKADMERTLERMKLEVSEANVRADDLERVLRGVCGTLDRTTDKITKCLNIKAELTLDESQKAEELSPAQGNAENTNASTDAVKVVSVNATEAGLTYADSTPSFQADRRAQQEKALRQMKELQEDDETQKKAKKEQGFFGWLTSRAASLLP